MAETRTIGELRAAGFDGIRIVCPGCESVVVTWWRLLNAGDGIRLPELVSKLRCGPCGARAGLDDVWPCQQNDAAPKRTA